MVSSKQGWGIYNEKIYGIWTVADVRGIWYWKDLLSEADVNPESLKTWDGYIQSAKELNEVLRPRGIEGVHLIAAGHSPDMTFYPYLWMLGGELIKMKEGHPTQGSYWFPAYNSTEGVRALEFVKGSGKCWYKATKRTFLGQSVF